MISHKARRRLCPNLDTQEQSIYQIVTKFPARDRSSVYNEGEPSFVDVSLFIISRQYTRDNLCGQKMYQSLIGTPKAMPKCGQDYASSGAPVNKVCRRLCPNLYNKEPLGQFRKRSGRNRKCRNKWSMRPPEMAVTLFVPITSTI